MSWIGWACLNIAYFLIRVHFIHVKWQRSKALGIKTTSNGFFSCIESNEINFAIAAFHLNAFFVIGLHRNRIFIKRKECLIFNGSAILVAGLCALFSGAVDEYIILRWIFHPRTAKHSIYKTWALFFFVSRFRFSVDVLYGHYLNCKSIFFSGECLLWISALIWKHFEAAYTSVYFEIWLFTWAIPLNEWTNEWMRAICDGFSFVTGRLQCAHSVCVAMRTIFNGKYAYLIFYWTWRPHLLWYRRKKRTKEQIPPLLLTKHLKSLMNILQQQQ